MSTELSTEISPEIINSLVLTGDMSKLTPTQQTQYYSAVCKSLNLNPLTQPFAIIVLQGKKTLYALKGCAQQLSNNNKISTEILSQKAEDGLYVVNSRAKMPDGRFTDEIGVVFIKGIQGADLANAMMKAVTKAKRRAVLALCGLGMPDESEVEDIKPEQNIDTSKSKVEKIVNQVEEATIVKAEEKKDVKKEEVKESCKPVDSNDKSTGEIRDGASKEDVGVGVQELPEGHHQIQAIITEWKCTPIGEEPNLRNKWVFTSGNLKLGTFDADLSGEICKVLDIQKKSGTPILMDIEYKERETTPGKFVKDIVSFKQVVEGKKVPI